MEVTWKQLHDRARTIPQKLCLELAALHLTTNPHSEFVKLVHRGMVWSTRELARNKNIIEGMTEDQLTLLLLAPLKGAGFAAYHDANVGGHCDISIEFDDDVVWLGEAKKHASYGDLLGGFRQLADRYSSGLVGQLDGGLVIYVFNKNAKSVMENWLAYLKDNVALKSCSFDESSLIGLSVSQHVGSGNDIIVCHYPAVLFHDPTDVQPAPKRKGI